MCVCVYAGGYTGNKDRQRFCKRTAAYPKLAVCWDALKASPLKEIAQANITLLGAFTFSCLISCISLVSVLNVVLHFLTVLKNVQCAFQCFIFFIARTLL